MNKEVNFSRFVGMGILLICIVIVVLALGSAIIRNENANNIIYVEDSTGTMLDIPKSNVVTEYINTEKNISIDDYMLQVKVRLPKVNIQTETIDRLNSEIYANYQDLYSYATTITSDESIEMDYNYDYLDNDSILEILITKKSTIDGKEENTVTKFRYDIVNDKML